MKQVIRAMPLFHILTLAEGRPLSLFTYVSLQTYPLGCSAQASS